MVDRNIYIYIPYNEIVNLPSIYYTTANSSSGCQLTIIPVLFSQGLDIMQSLSSTIGSGSASSSRSSGGDSDKGGGIQLMTNIVALCQLLAYCEVVYPTGGSSGSSNSSGSNGGDSSISTPTKTTTSGSDMDIEPARLTPTLYRSVSGKQLTKDEIKNIHDIHQSRSQSGSGGGSNGNGGGSNGNSSPSISPPRSNSSKRGSVTINKGKLVRDLADLNLTDESTTTTTPTTTTPIDIKYYSSINPYDYSSSNQLEILRKRLNILAGSNGSSSSGSSSGSSSSNNRNKIHPLVQKLHKLINSTFTVTRKNVSYNTSNT